jgi:hypothetical protein
MLNQNVKALGISLFIEGFSVDVNGYYNIYNDFIGNLNVVAPIMVQQDQLTLVVGSNYEAGLPPSRERF